MKCLYVLLTIIILQNSYAQGLVWENIYPNQQALGKMITVDSEDKIITVGNGFNQSGFANYIYIQKMNSEGLLTWKDSISTTVPNNSHRATWTGTDSNNNIIIVGYQYTLSLQNEVPNAMKLIKYSPSGALIFNKTISGTFGSGDISGIGKTNIGIIDELDKIYIGTAGLTNTQIQAGFVLLKYDNDGELIWEKVKNFSNVHGIHGMHYKNGKIVLVGNTLISGYNNQYAVWNSAGDLIWSGNSQSATQSWASDVLLDNNGNTYSLSQKTSGSYPKLVLTKYSINGSVLFSQTYDLLVSSAPGRIKMLNSGDLVISGTNWSTSGSNKIFVAKVSAINGSILYQNEQVLSQSNNWVYDVTVSENDNYYFIGSTNNNGGAPAETFIYAYSAENGFEWTTTYNLQGTEPMAIVLDSEEKIYTVIKNKFTVVKFGNELSENLDIQQHMKEIYFYPNPTKDFINFNFDSLNDNAVKIYNSSGREIQEYHSVNNRINVSNLDAGLYFGIIYKNRYENFVFKFVKE